jgi:hypothetical protein
MLPLYIKYHIDLYEYICVGQLNCYWFRYKNQLPEIHQTQCCGDTLIKKHINKKVQYFVWLYLLFQLFWKKTLFEYLTFSRFMSRELNLFLVTTYFDLQISSTTIYCSPHTNQSPDFMNCVPEWKMWNTL